MRISEIKKCFDDRRIQQCISHGFWDVDLFRQELEKVGGEPTPDYVYSIIRNTYLEVLEESTVAYKEERRYRRDLERLSNLIYGQTHYWMIGTKWENSLKPVAIISRRHQELHFLYERLETKKGKVKYDVIHKLAFDDELFKNVMDRERLCPIQSREDLFVCLEEIVMAKVNSQQLSRKAYSIMNCISFITYGDTDYWITKNNLDHEEIRKTIVDDNESNETQ